MRACRLRDSNTRPPRYEGGALPSELSRRKKDKMVSGGAPGSDATLQQGLPLRAERSAAGQFWTFTMSNSKTQNSESLVDDAKPRFTMRARILNTRYSSKTRVRIR